MKLFLEVLPKYNNLLEEYSHADLSDSETNAARNFNDNLKSLFSKYGIVPEEFSLFLQKVLTAYPALKDPTVNIEIDISEFAVLSQFQQDLEEILR